MTPKTIRVRNVQDAPLPLPPLPNAGGVVVATLPRGQYELRPQPDGSVLVARMDAAWTGDAGAPPTAATINAANRRFWDRQAGAKP